MKRNLAPVRTLQREAIPVIGSFGFNSGSLPYDGQSANFTVGLVVTGGTSGATGKIAVDTDAGATGTLKLTGVVGTFVDNEALTDSGTGAAVVNGSLTAAAANTPTLLKGMGFSVAWVSAGLFRVTLGEGLGFIHSLSVKAYLQLATADDKVAQVGSISVANRTVDIRIWDKSAAAVADPGITDANNRIHFAIWIKPTSAPLTRG